MFFPLFFSFFFLQIGHRVSITHVFKVSSACVQGVHVLKVSNACVQGVHVLKVSSACVEGV